MLHSSTIVSTLNEWMADDDGADDDGPTATNGCEIMTADQILWLIECIFEFPRRIKILKLTSSANHEWKKKFVLCIEKERRIRRIKFASGNDMTISLRILICRNKYLRET